MNRGCDRATCRRPDDHEPCARCWVPTLVVFEDPRVAYKAFLDQVLFGGEVKGQLRLDGNPGSYVATFDLGPSFTQLYACGKTPGAALDALIEKAECALRYDLERHLAQSHRPQREPR